MRVRAHALARLLECVQHVLTATRLHVQQLEALALADKNKKRRQKYDPDTVILRTLARCFHIDLPSLV